MENMLLKVQTAAPGSADLVLIYDETREKVYAVINDYELALVAAVALGMNFYQDKVYVMGRMTEDGEIMFDDRTVTREDPGW